PGCRSEIVSEGRRSQPPRWNSAPSPSYLALGPPQKESWPTCGEPQIDGRHAIGRLQQRGDQVVRSTGQEFDLPVAAFDGNYAPEQFGRRNGKVIVAQAVAAGNQARFLGTVPGGQDLSIHNPMDK